MFSSRILLASAAAAVLVLQADRADAMMRGEMVRIPAGSYVPLYGNGSNDRTVVSAFRIDRDAVTRAEYLAFVREHPEWSRSKVRSVMANRSRYLADWEGDFDIGAVVSRSAPVTNVSWFSARAFCEAKGKRLPTVSEWEYVAAASASVRDAARDLEFIQQLVSIYVTRPAMLPSVMSGMTNAYGVRGLHGLVSEWVEDFNSVLVSDDSRGVGGRDHEFFCASAAIGAVDPSNYPAFLRYALRSGLNGRTTLQTMGFRCAV